MPGQNNANMSWIFLDPGFFLKSLLESPGNLFS